MQILDEDMQMVRDFLAANGAPEYVKGHFENLIGQHAKEAARAEELQDRVRAMEECDSVELTRAEDRVAELEDQLDDIAGDGLRGTLEHVRDWLHDVLVLNRPMRDPRKVMRVVDDALWTS